MPETHNAVVSALRTTPGWQALRNNLPPAASAFRLTGVRGSTDAAVLAALHADQPDRVILAVTSDPNAARALEADLVALLGDGVSHVFPQREGLPWDATDPHVEYSGLRVEAVESLFSGSGKVFVTTIRGLQERFPVPAQLTGLRIRITTGEKVSFQGLVERLEARGFERVPIVEEIGQFAVRGGLIDVFSVGAPDPLRIEFWGDEIDSIRTFDILDQRSTGTLEEAAILPVAFGTTEDEATELRSLLELVPTGALLVDIGETPWTTSVSTTWDSAHRTHAELIDSGMRAPTPVEDLFLAPEVLLPRARSFARLELRSDDPTGDASLGSEPPPTIDRDMERLREVLREGAARDEQTLILC
ncbi:MAG TPA: hypothetical protein VJ925_01710, partial [Longimicrobiales bacterium]|nr:hypothetical protein [Longimicrobiales bacterium]